MNAQLITFQVLRTAPNANIHWKKMVLPLPIWHHLPIKLRYCVDLTQHLVCNISFLELSILNIFPVLQAASRAIEFWSFQMDLSNNQNEGQSEDLKQKLLDMEKAHQQKIIGLQNNIKSLSSQLDSVKMERDLQKREIVELHEQYTERVRQKKQLEDLYNNLKKNLDDSFLSSQSSSDQRSYSIESPYKPKSNFLQPQIKPKESKADIFKALSPLNKSKLPSSSSHRNLFTSQLSNNSSMS